ncbi:GNAT family N-acetyltransferase [Erwinia sp. JUb26]|uniref:GNAT family N-acetyltransferase n=1 Tax=Erwinia sp. JUb26 TaxID=2485126 RepID=UPI000F4A6185|nr:GNAT family N-acetyltransferase [Erwinia sp. JUb26]ROR13383.1 N-acetylglutamate synthase-like GNAT family acetyltransferase [Erwinia sp. JUb26]
MSETGKTLRIEPYSAKHQAAVLELILPIQTQEFGIPITAEQQPDLNDIENFYQQGHGQFWLALVDDRVVGCIALKDIGHRQAALRKMFVAAEYRGKTYGTGLALLNILLAYGREQELTDVFLGTTALFLAAHRFYEKNGFTEIAVSDLPASFPVMKVDTKFYRYTV